VVAAAAALVTDRTLTAETFRDRDALEEAAKRIEQMVGASNLVHRIDQDEESTFKIVFSHTNNGATPPTVVDLTLFHSGELREIRKLDADLETYKVPFKIRTGDEERTVEALKAVADAVVAAGQKGIEIQRYKGLGEMNPDQLWETTMNPEKRSMLRVEVGSQEEAEEIFSRLMGDQVEPRRQFIEENALNVRNLDI
jgi:DNA gyrase subunit B